MISSKDLVEYGSTALVFACAALAGHYAAEGMSAVQWAGALAAVVGSVTLAVAVRTWPNATKPDAQRD